MSVSCWASVSFYALGAGDRTSEAAQEPRLPIRNVHPIFLRCFEQLAIGVPLGPTLGRHALEALGAPFRSGQGHVGDGPGDTAVAIVERMYGYEPEMRESGLRDRVDVGFIV